MMPSEEAGALPLLLHEEVDSRIVREAFDAFVPHFHVAGQRRRRFLLIVPG